MATWAAISRDIKESPFAARYAQYRDLFERGRAARDIFFPVRPSAFIEWASARCIDLPEAMMEVVSSIVPLEDLRKAYDEEVQRRKDVERELEHLKAEADRISADKGLSQRERSSCLKLIIGMAVKKYRYDAAAARSATATNIADDMHNLGIDIDVDTVRKWLKEAAEELSPAEAE